MIRTCFVYFSAMKMSSFITIRPYLDFQNIFSIDWCTVKFFFTITDFIPNIILIFQNTIIFNQMIHSFSFHQLFTYALVLGSIMCTGLIL